jgi:poly-beta-hydroxybutyrate-responsive repressor
VTKRGDDKRTDASETARDMPKDFLTPWLLLLLHNWRMHGYQIIQMMTISGLAAFDPTTVYRTLRRLEEEGLIISGWEMSESGPAKRVYSITKVGEKFLQTWASVLKEYQDVLDRFFELYTQTMQPLDMDNRKKASA